LALINFIKTGEFMNEVLKINQRDRLLSILISPTFNLVLFFVAIIIYALIIDNAETILYALLGIPLFELTAYIHRMTGVSVWGVNWKLESISRVGRSQLLVVRDSISRKRIFKYSGTWEELNASALTSINETTEIWLDYQRDHGIKFINWK
jgi:hypothetical protein